MKERICREVWAGKKSRNKFRTSAVGNLTGVNERIVMVQTEIGNN